MANKMNLQESILNAVNTIVEQRTNELKVDKTITAIIEKNMGVFSGKALYKLMYEGGFFEAVVLNPQEIYLPNTSVYVLIPQGDFSKEKIIIGRANNINFDKEFTTIVSAASQYSLVGGNLLYNAKKDDKVKTSNLQYGVYSYHDPIEEEENSNSILHRYNLICSYDANNEYTNELLTRDISTQNLAFNEQNLDLLKDQTTALMLKADFKTNLTREQQQCSSGEYGLILNLVFDNLNKSYGSTNGEIFEKVAENIVGDAYISKTQAENFNCKSLSENDYDYYTLKLKNIHDYYINQIKNNQDIKTCVRLLIEYTNNLKTTFSTNNSTKALYTDDIKNILTAYLNLLNELELCEELNSFNEHYNIWWNTVVNNTKNKIISYKFSSNNMIGNPLSFSQWSTQYQILNVDVKNLIRVDSIVLYKEGFIENSVNESNWPIKSPGPDIFIKNIQLYPIKPIDSENGDYTLKVQPKDLENNSNAGVLNSTSAEEIVTFEAILMRKNLENLSKGTKVSYNWFKEDFSIVDANSAGYDIMAGAGWRKINSAGSYNFITNAAENLAYKNNYKCVVQYMESNNNTIVLNTIFSIYNKIAKINILLESNLGTIFSFDAGIPEITCKINEESNESDNIEDYKENNSADYEYYWAITDAANGTKIFLNENSNNDNDNILTYITTTSILDSIKCYKLNNNLEKVLTEDSVEATRISYPVNRFSSGFTVECFVKKNIPIDNSSDTHSIDIGSATLEFLNKGLDIDLNSFKINIENGSQVFQYDEYGNAPNSIKQKDPLNILPLQAKIYAPSGVEIQNSNYFIEWIFPTENTMIVAGETLELNSTTQVPQIHRGETCNFDIFDIYNPDYWNNQITCHVRYNNQDLYKDTEFLFTKTGENGTNGTDVTAKIFYKGNDILNTLHNEPLTLYVQNDNSAMFNVPDHNNKMQTLYEDLPIVDENGILDIALYQKGQQLSEDNYTATYPRWTFLGNSSYSKSYGKYFSLKYENGISEIHWNGSDEDTQKYLYQIIKAEVQLKTGQMYYATYNLPIIWYKKEDIDISNIEHKIAIDRDNYLSSILYNADGRNPIYNHNQGLKIINIPENVSKIVWVAKGGKLTDNGSNSCFKFIDENDDIVTTLIKESDIKSEEMVYVLPNDIYDGGVTNNYIEIAFYEENDTLFAIAYVPIYMSLNTFGLASLNAWDGNHVTVNEDEGYIMSPQIGAGEKDENNRFTGILMGTTEGEVGKTGQTESQTGLFGYAKGIQSIFLDAKTGNASFGLPNGLHWDEKGNLTEDNFEEGRIELRPGGESVIGGWTLGNRSLYYTSKKDEETKKWVRSGKLYKRTEPDYIPNWKTGLIEKDNTESYSKNHEKDIKSDESGILLYAGENPYISIKGRPFKKEDIPQNEVTEEKESFIKPDDSIELQLDPATPTLFTIFRHNGGQRTGIEGQTGDNNNYEIGSRTFLAGINSQGEFIANGLRNANTTDIVIPTGINKPDATWKAGSLITKFAVNTLNAFEDFSDDDPKTSHVGFEITANEKNTLAHFFTKINGLEIKNNQEDISDIYNPTLHISGGFTSNEGEYSRPLALHGKNVQIYAMDGTMLSSSNANKFLSETDAHFNISTNEANLQLGSTHLNLFRYSNNNNSLLTTGDLKINVGDETEEAYIVEEVNISTTGEDWQQLDKYIDYYKYKIFSSDYCYVQNSDSENTVATPSGFKYVNLIAAKNYYDKIIDDSIENKYYIDPQTRTFIALSNPEIYYKATNSDNYILVTSYDEDIYYKNDNGDIKNIKDIYVKTENNQYYPLSTDEDIDENNLQQYYISVEKTDEEKNNEQYKYVSKNSYDNNLYYTDDNYNGLYIKIDSVEKTYYKKLDENDNVIYINSDNIEDNPEPFIIVKGEPDQYENYDVYYYFKNKFDYQNLYFRLKIDNKYYYVTNFTLNKYIKNGEDLEKDFSKSFSTDPNTEHSYWLNDYYTEHGDIVYKIIPYFIGDNRPENGADEFDVTVDIIDFNIESSFSNSHILNVYRRYTERLEEGMPEYVLQSIVDTSTLYYYYYNTTKFYSNIIDENDKIYYKVSNNEEDSYIEILNENFWYYDSELNAYIESNNINTEDTYQWIDNNYEIVDVNNIENPNDDYLYKQITLPNDVVSFKWITLASWLGLASLLEYCENENEEYMLKTNFSTEQQYLKKNDEEYVPINSNDFEYIYIEDNRSSENFFVSISNFKNIYEDETNRRLFIGNTEYNIGVNKWDTNFDDENIKIRVNENKIIRQRKIPVTYSNKNYTMYSGTYQNYIQKSNSDSTKISINTNINIRNTRLINLYSNNNFNITLTNINDTTLNNDNIILDENGNINNNLITKSGQIYLGSNISDKEKYKKKSIWGQFVHIENDNRYGMVLTSDSTYLLGKNNGEINAADTIKIITNKLGNGSLYNQINPQILLRAGDDSNHATKLILNSSNNGWKSIRGNDKLKSYPIFQVKSRSGNIGIIPQYITKKGKKYYYDYFVVNMSQGISEGLNIQGIFKGNTKECGLIVSNNISAKKFLGTNWNSLFNFTVTSKGTEQSFGSGYKQKSKSMIGKTVSFNVPRITVYKSGGQPKISQTSVNFTFPSANSIWNAIAGNVAALISKAGFLTQTAADARYVSQATYNRHSHSINTTIPNITVKNKDKINIPIKTSTGGPK